MDESLCGNLKIKGTNKSCVGGLGGEDQIRGLYSSQNNRGASNSIPSWSICICYGDQILILFSVRAEHLTEPPALSLVPPLLLQRCKVADD